MADSSKKVKQASDEFWITPFDKIVGVVEEKTRLVQVYEYHARGSCRGASAWVAYHYPRTGSVVKSARADGARSIFTLRLGRGELDLKPSVSPAGIESARIVDGELSITYAGLAGGGVGIARSRSLAKNISRVDISSPGGGSKLGSAKLLMPVMHKVHVGIDDTDSKETGATWSLANEIGWHASKKAGIEYLNHTIVQLYPMAPRKTKNCVSTVLTFGVKPPRKKSLIAFIRSQLEKHTVSNDTGMAVFEGIRIPRRLRKYSERCRNEIITHNDALETAGEVGAELQEITGKAGLIGALAAIGYAEEHDEAVKLPRT